MNPTDTTPRQREYRWPAEWERHRATWLVWPHNIETWPGRFDEAREQFAEFVTIVARFEPVELLAVDEAYDHAAERLADVPRCRIHPVRTNDSWIRDYGPIFLNGPLGAPPLLIDWQYNAWGEKYGPYDLDNQVPKQIAALTGRQRVESSLVVEGGAVEGNGAAVVLTTESCLLNPNRNGSLSPRQIETTLRDYLCADHIVWLAGDIPGDDTDGHIDQIGRFVNAETVLLADLPGSDMFDMNRRRLKCWSRQTGASIEVVRIRIPAPRQVGGMWLPASYANFSCVNGAILVPAFSDPADDAAIATLAKCFPDREVIGVPSSELIFGLGSLHCLSQQEPDERLDRS